VSTARVDFTRGAAERIARVVRLVEQGDRDGAPLTFGSVNDQAGGKELRLGTFTGDWQINQIKTVTFQGVTSTPNTASVVNLCNSVEGLSGQQRVIFAKARHTSGYVAVELPAAAAGLFRICTFTGAWSKNSAKVVSLKYMTATPNTFSATNLFADITASSSVSRNCAIAKEGGSWYLVAAEC
jgi:hypothetical protein